MKKQILKRILILIIPVFLFLGSQEAKADTFTWMDFGAYSEGGAGFDDCSNCHSTWTLQTDKADYTPGEAINLLYFKFTDQNPNPSPENLGSRLLRNYINWPGVYFSEDSFLADISWVGLGNEIFTNPYGSSIDPNFTGIPSGYFVVNYNGNYQPDDPVTLYPQTTFSVSDPAPSNNNPVVDVR